MVNMASLRGVVRICRRRETAPCMSPCLNTTSSLHQNSLIYLFNKYMYLINIFIDAGVISVIMLRGQVWGNNNEKLDERYTQKTRVAN